MRHIRSLVQLVCFAGSFALIGSLQVDAQVSETGKRWIDMDYGPYMTHSFQASRPAKNIAYKGVKIRLGDGGQSMLFDTDLLRWSAGWQSSALDWRSVLYDGSHNTHPGVIGEPVFANPVLPGWASDGSFEDPRELPYGPLPRDWANWKGLYTHDDAVVLSYTVRGADVLESPTTISASDRSALVRQLQIGKSSSDLVLQVAQFEGEKVQLLSPKDLMPSDSPSVGKSIAVVGSFSPLKETAQAEPVDEKLNRELLAHWSFDEADEKVANLVGEKRNRRKGQGAGTHRQRPCEDSRRRRYPLGPRGLDHCRLGQNNRWRNDRRPRPRRRKMATQRQVAVHSRRTPMFRHRLGRRRAIGCASWRWALASCGGCQRKDIWQETSVRRWRCCGREGIAF